MSAPVDADAPASPDRLRAGRGKPLRDARLGQSPRRAIRQPTRTAAQPTSCAVFSGTARRVRGLDASPMPAAEPKGRP